MVKKKKAEFKVVVKGNFVSDDFKKEIKKLQGRCVRMSWSIETKL